MHNEWITQGYVSKHIVKAIEQLRYKNDMSKKIKKQYKP